MKPRHLLVAASLAALFWIGRVGVRVLLTSDEEILPAPIPGVIEDGDRELQLVVIVSGACGACADPVLPDLVEESKAKLAERARAERLGFATIAIGIDSEVERSRRNVKRFGEFHEVSLGRTWLNSGALSYIWTGHPGPASVPQIIVAERTFSIHSDRIAISDSRVRARMVGLGELVRWEELGFPISN